MAKILPDRAIQPLIGTVLVNADPENLNPNGIELRLGRDVLFHSTGEEAHLEEGMFLKVAPGESVVISNLESIDFTTQTVQEHLPGCMLMGLITPTTTMMREGISQVATKIDAGFQGSLNWGLRNGSIKDLVIQYGEPIFKLTIFALEAEEAPELPYGERQGDRYQGSEGVIRSTRRLPADIPRKKLLASTFAQLDPKKQLREAGYPFDHIGTELTNLHGKFEVVSSDVRLMKDEFDRKTQELARTIEKETAGLSRELESARQSLLDRVDSLFDRKFYKIAGVVVGAIPLMYGGVVFLQGADMAPAAIGYVAVVVGAVILALTFVLGKREAAK